MEDAGKSKGRILVVDDNEAIITSISKVLKKEGYKVGYAYDGSTALKKVLTSRYDLILLDITLPDIDGYEVCRSIKENHLTSNIPVIFISILDDDSIYKRGFELGVMDYLKKPVPASELIFRIKNYLRLRETEIKLQQSESFFKSIVEDQTEFVVRHAPDGTLIFVNRAFCNYLKKECNEIIGKNLFDLLNLEENDKIRAKSSDLRLILNNHPIQMTGRDGKTKWHQWTCRIIKDRNTHETIIQAVGRDITELKEQEDTTRIWETIFKNAGWGIVTSLPNSQKFGQMNDTYAKMHGYEPSELIGKEIWKVFAHRSHSFAKSIYTNLEKTGHYSYHAVHKKKSGEEFICNSDVWMIKDEKGKNLLEVANVTDISELIKTSKALVESEEKFRTVFLNTPDVILIIRLNDFSIVDANERFFETSGYTKEEVLNSPHNLNRFFESPGEGKRLMKLVKQNKILSGIESRLKLKKDYSYPALISFSKIKLNRVTHVVTIIRNIEEIKKFQESILQNETKFRLLADYNYNWEFWLGSDNKYIYVSPSCERITGYKAEEFLHYPGLMADVIHPLDRKKVMTHFKNEHINKGEETSLEFMIIDRNGNEKWISHNCNPVFDNNGAFLGRRGNNLDITSKKISEKELLKLSTAVEQSSSAIIITDTDGLIEYVNPYFEMLTGYSSSEVIGNNPKILKSGKTDPKIYKDLWDSVTSGKIWQGEFINKKKSGEIFIEHAIISPVKDETDKIVNYVAIKQDITKQKEVDRKILQTIISTEEKERSRFAQDLHDDLGPLLSTAKLYIRSFETASDPKNKEIAITRCLRAIDEAIMSIKEIANNISPHILRNFGLTSGINSLVNKINETNTVNISFSTRLVERFDEITESSIFRVVSELVNNTIKHAGAQRIYIDLNKSENDIMLIYSDDGIGFHIDNALNKQMSRGLSNILNRVKSLGGEIELDSAPDKGFNVFIRIPVADHQMH